MTHITRAYRSSQLYLQGHDAPVAPLDDQVDLVFPAPGAQMEDPGLGCLGVDADREGDQRFEQCSEQAGVLRCGATGRTTFQEGVTIHSEEAGGQGGVGQVVPGRLAGSAKMIAAREPAGYVIDYPQLLES